MLALIGATVLVWRTFRDVDPTSVSAGLSRIGLPLLLTILVVPKLAAFLFEVLGWQEAFRLMGARVPLLGLLRVRVASDALSQTLPAGALWCESVKPLLLGRHCGTEVSVSVAGMAARKYLRLAGQVPYVLAAFVVGYGALAATSDAVIGFAGLPWLALACAVIMGGAAFGMALVFGRGSLAGRVAALLEAMPVRAVRRFARARKSAFAESDHRLADLFDAPLARLALPVASCFASWLVEAVETYLILVALGAPIDFATVLAFEVVLGVVRNALFILPGGIGVQDVGYASFLVACGMPNALPLAATFIIVKRGREVLWTLAGYGLLLAERRPRAAHSGEPAGAGTPAPTAM